MAYGEDATSLAFNRAFSAISSNIDFIKGVLDAPALRPEVLSPIRDSTDFGGSKAGFFVLNEKDAVTNPNGLIHDTNRIDLAGALQADTVPPVWVYLGLHQKDLKNFVRFYGSGTDQTLYDSRGDLARREIVVPTDAKTNAIGGDSFFPPTEYHGDDLHAVPYKIPPIAPVRVSLSPYSGSSRKFDILRWESDGLTIRSSGLSFSDLYLRPGCYLYVENDGDPLVSGKNNNGLYQIASIQHSQDVGPGGAGDKAVLTRGNLAKVTVNDHSKYDPGDLVTWRPTPEHNNPVDTPEERVHSAHVAFIVPRPDLPSVGVEYGDLYLAQIGGSEDFTGQKSSDTSWQKGGRRLYGNVGLPDKEEGAFSNWTMPKPTPLSSGTLLWKWDGANWDRAEVVEVISPSAPVYFRRDINPGIVTPCNPLGFLLNPLLIFGFGSYLGKNDYYVHCNTLTTVGEQLRSRGSSATLGSYEDPSSPMIVNQGDMRAITDFARHIRMGYDQWAPPLIDDSQYGDKFSPSRLSLGNDLYSLRLAVDAGPGQTFEDACNAVGLGVGDTIVFGHPLEVVEPDPPFVVGQSRKAVGKIVSFSFNRVIIKNVQFRPGIGQNMQTGGQMQVLVSQDQGLGLPGPGGSFTTVNGTIFVVEKLYSGNVSNANIPHQFTPTGGLNAAFHNDYSADPEERGQHGSGNWISYASNANPITVFLSDDLTAMQRLFVARTDLSPDPADASPQDQSIGLIEVTKRKNLNTGSNNLHGLLAGIKLSSNKSYIEELYGVNYASGTLPDWRGLTFYDERSASWTFGSSFGLGFIGDHDYGSSVGIPLTCGNSHSRHLTHGKPPAQGDGPGTLTTYGGTGITGGGPGAFNYSNTPIEVSTHSSEASSSVMAALEAALTGNYLPYQDAVPVNSVINRPQRQNSFGSLSNGVIKGAEQSFWMSPEDTFGNTQQYDPQHRHCIDFREAWFLKGGAKVYCPETRISLPNVSGKYYIFFDFHVDTLPMGPRDHGGYVAIEESDLPTNFGLWEDPWRIPICETVVKALPGTDPLLTYVSDARQRISRQDKRCHIYVGQTGGHEPTPAIDDEAGPYANDIAHFNTLGAALKAIETWEALRANGNEFTGARHWTIEVISWTWERQDAARGISWPYRMPADGITIRGRACDRGGLPGAVVPPTIPDNGTPLILWGELPVEGEEQNLLDINQKHGLVFRDLSFTWLNAEISPGLNEIAVNRNIVWGAAGNEYAEMPGVNLFINRTANPVGQSNRGFDFLLPQGENPIFQNRSSDILIENVHLKGGTGFFFHVDHGNMENLTIRDCSAIDITNTFVTLEPVSHDLHNGGVGTTSGYHQNITIDNCTAISQDNTNATTGVEALYCNAIHLTAVTDFTVSNCKIIGFKDGVCCRDATLFFTQGSPGGSGPLYGFTGVHVDSYGTISDCHFSYQWHHGVFAQNRWESITEGGYGGYRVLNCTFKDFANNRDLFFLPTSPFWGGWTTNYEAPAIDITGSDAQIDGNQIIRLQLARGWEEPTTAGNQRHHYLIACGGDVNVMPGADALAYNVQVTNNSATCLPGHSFIRMVNAVNCTISENREDLMTRPALASGLPHSFYNTDPGTGPNNYLPVQASFRGHKLTDCTITNNIFAALPEYGSYEVDFIRCNNIKNVGNVWAGWWAYSFRTAAGYCEALNHLVEGNDFNGVSVLFSGSNSHADNTKVLNNNFSLNRNYFGNDFSNGEPWGLDELGAPYEGNEGGDIIFGGGLNSNQRSYFDQVHICGNTTQGGSIKIAEESLIGGATHMQYLGMVIDNNNLLSSVRGETIGSSTHEIYPKTKMGSKAGGMVWMEGFPVGCKITNNLVGQANYAEIFAGSGIVSAGIAVGWTNASGGANEFDQPEDCLIAHNELWGSKILTAGSRFEISHNKGVTDIWHNVDPNNGLSTGLKPWTGAAYGQRESGALGAKICWNEHVYQLETIHYNNIFDSDYATSIMMVEGVGGKVSNNTNCMWMNFVACSGLDVSYNDFNPNCSFWQGGHGITLGFGGWLNFEDGCHDLNIEGNDLLWNFDSMIGYNRDQLPLSINWDPFQGAAIPGWFSGWWNDPGMLPENEPNLPWNPAFQLNTGRTGYITVSEDGVSWQPKRWRVSNNTTHGIRDPSLSNVGLTDCIITANQFTTNMWFDSGFKDLEDDPMRLYSRPFCIEATLSRGHNITGNTAYAGFMLGWAPFHVIGSAWPYDPEVATAGIVFSSNNLRGSLADTYVMSGGITMVGNNYATWSSLPLFGAELNQGHTPMGVAERWSYLNPLASPQPNPQLSRGSAHISAAHPIFYPIGGTGLINQYWASSSGITSMGEVGSELINIDTQVDVCAGDGIFGGGAGAVGDIDPVTGEAAHQWQSIACGILNSAAPKPGVPSNTDLNGDFYGDYHPFSWIQNQQLGAFNNQNQGWGVNTNPDVLGNYVTTGAFPIIGPSNKWLDHE
jgi:hypothetical protein